MPQTSHIEHHFPAGDAVRDIVIGMSDGLVIPFALAAGLSGVVSSSTIIVTAGFAEIVAGAIALGVSSYLATRSDEVHYANERLREQQEVSEKADAEKAEVRNFFMNHGLAPEERERIVKALSQHSRAWMDFMMRFKLGPEEPDPMRTLASSVMIALSYIAGGLIPLSPYILLPVAGTALLTSVVVTLLTLFIFGYLKGRFTNAAPLRSGLQTALIGGLAAAAAFMIAHAIS